MGIADPSLTGHYKVTGPANQNPLGGDAKPLEYDVYYNGKQYLITNNNKLIYMGTLHKRDGNMYLAQLRLPATATEKGQQSASPYFYMLVQKTDKGAALNLIQCATEAERDCTAKDIQELSMLATVAEQDPQERQLATALKTAELGQDRSSDSAKMPPNSDDANSTAFTNWQRNVVDILTRNKKYPADAQSRHEEGLVVVHFTLDRGGNLIDSRVSRSSGSVALDEAALAVIRISQPFPPLPETYRKSDVNLTVPMRFRLSDGIAPPTNDKGSQSDGQMPASSSVGLSQQDLDALRSKIASSYVPPPEPAKSYVITIRMKLTRDRRLAETPVVLSRGEGYLFKSACDSVLNAVEKAQPYDMLPLTSYDSWKELDIRFDLHELTKSKGESARQPSQ